MLSVLVIDGSAMMRDATQRVLREAGFETHGAASPEEARELLEGVCVDAAVLDLNLRHGDALDLLRTIRQDAFFKILPVVLYLSTNDSANITKAKRLGVSAVLHKDQADPVDLVAGLETSVKGKSTRKFV